MSFIESNIRARQRERYMVAVHGQGLSFVELRTPPDGLPLGDRPRTLKYPDGPVDDADRLHVLPPVQLFGDGARSGTAEVLAGKWANAPWWWDEWDGEP